MSPVLMPNATPGDYNLTASVAGLAPISFPLINVDYSLAMHTPGTVQITPGTAATVLLDMATIPANTPMPDGVFLSCLLPVTFLHPYCGFSRPAGLAESFPGLDVGAANVTVTLTIFTSGVAGNPVARLPVGNPGALQPLPQWTYLSLLLSTAMIGILIAAKETVPFRKLQMSVMFTLLVVVAAGLMSCGGGSATTASSTTESASPASPTPPGPSTITVTSTVSLVLGGSVSKSIQIPINVN